MKKIFSSILIFVLGFFLVGCIVIGDTSNLKLAEKSVELQVGTEYTIPASTVDGTDITYSLNNSNVSIKGDKITAETIGQTIITIKAGEETKEFTVTVIPYDEVDYVSELKLDMNSDSAKIQLGRDGVKSYIDGDTTHFNVPTSIDPSGVLKARYIAIDTPESTGQIEEYGKKASNFTKEHLKNAVSIVIESDNSTWNHDSTGERYVVWVWYKTSENSDYRNLNLEILQNGLSRAKNSASNRYGDICVKAFAQARLLKLNIYSGKKDPDFYYGAQIELTLKELRTNIADYLGKDVAFEAVIARSYNNSIYVQEYDEETGLLYGISVFYGYNFGGESVLKNGTRLRIVGNVQYYENGGTYQIANLYYDMMKPNDPKTIKVLGENQEIITPLVDGKTFNSKVTLDFTVEKEDDTTEVVSKQFDYGYLTLNTAIQMEGLTPTKIYTTKNGDSKGAMTITCRTADGSTVTVRTNVLYDTVDGEKVLVDESYFTGKTFNVRGLVEYYEGSYQIKAVTFSDITFVEGE